MESKGRVIAGGGCPRLITIHLSSAFHPDKRTMATFSSFTSQRIPKSGWLYKNRMPVVVPDYSLIFVVDVGRAQVRLHW